MKRWRYKQELISCISKGAWIAKIWKTMADRYYVEYRSFYEEEWDEGYHVFEDLNYAIRVVEYNIGLISTQTYTKRNKDGQKIVIPSVNVAKKELEMKKPKCLNNPILKDKLALEDIFASYNEPHRKHHNLQHIKYMLHNIDSLCLNKKTEAILTLATLYHDIVYNPIININEKLSLAQFALDVETETAIPEDIYQGAKRLIKYSRDYTVKPETNLEAIFAALDLHTTLVDIPVGFESNINVFKEYQYVDFKTFRRKRKEILRDIARVFKDGMFHNNAEALCAHLDSFRPKIGIYAGSFNPFHLGHLDILEKAEKIFDKVVVAMGCNSQKITLQNKELENIYTPVIEVLEDGRLGGAYIENETPEIKPILLQLKKLKRTLPLHEIVLYTTLLTDFIQRYTEYADVTLIRGLRNGHDLQYENNLVSVLKDLMPELSVVYIPCDSKYSHISSSAIRELKSFSNKNPYRVDKYNYLFGNAAT